MGRILSILLALLTVLALGCQTPQRSISEDELIARKPTLLSAARAEIDRLQAAGDLRIEAEHRVAMDRPGANSNPILVDPRAVAVFDPSLPTC